MTRGDFAIWLVTAAVAGLSGEVSAGPQDTTNDPKANYSAVRLQQGNVKLDADWNESVRRRAADDPELKRLREHLLTRLGAADSQADMGLLLLELFTTVGDTLATYQDRITNEAEMETARKRHLATMTAERLRALQAEIVRSVGDQGRLVTVRDEQEGTRVQFGDGATGQRLPTGMSDVIAAYGRGAGAAPRVRNLKAGTTPVPGGAVAAWSKGSLRRDAAESISRQLAERAYRICTIRDRATRSPTLSVYTVPGEHLHTWLYETEGFPGETEEVVSIEPVAEGTTR